jgi:hypothetical protein
MADQSHLVEVIDIAGGIASVLGLAIGVWVLIVATGAKRAAEEARVLTQRRSLIEDLEIVSHKLQQIGIFFQQQQWFAIQLRIDDVAAICRSAMTRWSDRLEEDTKNNVLTAVRLMRSIAEQATDLERRAPSPAEMKKIGKAHSNASGFINDALGEARRLEERQVTQNAD